LPRPSGHSTSHPGILESRTHCPTMNCIAQTCCNWNLVLWRPGIESCVWGTLLVLATVPSLDRFYYKSSKMTRNRKVQFPWLPDCSLN
jgi:hypothetical protein